MIVFWLLPVFVVLHIMEEFVFPGGFMVWYRNYKSSASSSFTVRYSIIINGILVIFSVLPLVLGRFQHIPLWLSIASVVFFNALFHITGSIRLSKYSPGIITSILLYIPISIYGYWFFISKHLISIDSATGPAMTGLLYLWFASFNHRRRAKRLERN